MNSKPILKTDYDTLNTLKQLAHSKYQHLAVDPRYTDGFVARCYLLAAIEILTSQGLLDIVIEDVLLDVANEPL